MTFVCLVSVLFLQKRIQRGGRLLNMQGASPKKMKLQNLLHTFRKKLWRAHNVISRVWHISCLRHNIYIYIYLHKLLTISGSYSVYTVVIYRKFYFIDLWCLPNAYRNCIHLEIPVLHICWWRYKFCLITKCLSLDIIVQWYNEKNHLIIIVLKCAGTCTLPCNKNREKVTCISYWYTYECIQSAKHTWKKNCQYSDHSIYQCL